MSTAKLIFAALTTTALLASTSISQAENLNVEWKGAPEFSSANGNFKMKLRGRLIADWASSYDNGGKAVDATEFRAARMGVEGTLMKDIKYKFEADFTGNQTEIIEANIVWALKPVSVVIGQFKTPNSLEEQTSGRFVTFLERGGFTDAFDLNRQIGIAADYAEGDITFKAGLFQGNANGGAGTVQGRTYAGRITYTPKFDRGFIHVGASAFYRENDDGDLTNRYRQRAHSHLANRYVDTSSFDAQSDTFFGVELAGVMGRFSAQTEWGWMKSTAPEGSMDAKFSGGYVDVSYFLTKHCRGYKGGAFDRVQVKDPVYSGGKGAWQIAARYDVIDLSDEDAMVIGGKQTSYIVGLNWYLNKYSRVVANYAKSDIDGGANDGESIDTFGLRFQVDW